MTHAIIGWEQEVPVRDHIFNDFLSARNGHLYFEELDLAQLFPPGETDLGIGKRLPGPLELVYLPKIRQKIEQMKQVFARVSVEIGYAGHFHYAYASKANVSEEVVRTALETGAHYEMSSRVDVDIAHLMKIAGHLPPTRMVLANGFKPTGSEYAHSLIQFKSSHANLIPIIEDLTELPPFIESGLPFDVGLRQKSYGHHQTEAEMEVANSRFGLNTTSLWQAAELIAASPHLRLKLYHAMVGGQITNEQEFLTRLRAPMEMYARLRQRHSDLTIFDFGGGMPVPLTLGFHFDYHHFVRLLLTALQEVCARHAVPVPDMMGEFGRYTTAEHGAHFFKVILAKDNGSPWPWYIIIGAYQEMLGGVRGSKHCILPEADELIVDRTDTGRYQFHLIPGQMPRDLLRNLGYSIPGVY